MKRTYKRILQAAVCICLCALMLMGGAIPLGAEERDLTDLFDYTLPTLEKKQSLSASEIFYHIYGAYPPEAEKAYLDQLSGITLRYSDLIPPSIVSTNYNGDAGTLDVTVPAYTYTASNGALVKWIPEKATLEGVEKTFSGFGEEYACRFENLLYSKDFDIHVTFTWLVELPAEAVDALLTKPTAEGLEALKTVEAYEETYLNPYLELLKKYEVYQAYQEALKDHAQYLLDLEQYEKDLEKYKAYLTEYEQYLKEKASYDAYIENKTAWDQYYAYQDFKKNDLEKYNQYLLYQNTVNKVLSKLAILESLFVSDSNKWTFYPSLMGSTVTSVTSRKDELITAGCNAKDILNADSATMELRRLLTDYSNLRKAEYASQHDKITALYNYYTAHYTEIRDGFALLYGSLIALYDNEFVVIYADKEGKLERFQQFMGQLYVTTTCLDDSDTGMRMENWKISGKSLSTVVEAINLLPDTGNSDPKDVSMPEKEAERIEAVAPVEKPSVTLSPVPKPKEIPEVKEPEKPAFVAEPDKENPPPVATHPGAAPARPPMEDTLWNLALALRDGSVPSREAQGLSRSFALQKTVACPISIHNLKTVTFYDMDGTTVLYQEKVDYGTAVTYQGPAMNKSDPYYVYTFRGWVLSDGTPASFDQVCENLSIFANYHVERRAYRVRWILDGVTTDTYFYYGDLPKPPFSLDKPGGGDMMYQFTGWDKEIVPVTENAVYTGGFELVPRTYTVTWVLGDKEITEQVQHGTLPTFPEKSPSYSDGVNYFEFLGWDKDTSVPVTGDKTFYAKYTKKTLVTAGNGAALEVVNDGKSLTVLAGSSDVFVQNVAKYASSLELPLTIHWNHFAVTYSDTALTTLISSACDKVDLEQHTVSGGVSYTLSYQDATGKDLSVKPGALLVLYPMNEDGSGCQYSISEGGTWQELPAGERPISGSVTLLLKEACRIVAAGSEFCNVSALPLYAVPGQWVDLDIACEFGYEIVGAVITKANGMKTEVEGTGFQMPVGEVSIQLKVEKIVYHVIFEVDGEVYSQADYFLGDEIKLPEAPQKASDDTYSYEFLEWSPTVTIAMGEDRKPIYRAVFSKNLLNGVDPYHSGNNNNAFLNTYLPIGLGVVAIVVGLIIFLRVRKKRRLAAATGQSADDTVA